MKTLKKPKFKKLVFDYSKFEGAYDAYDTLPVHKALLARINAVLGILNASVNTYHGSVHVDTNKLVLSITEPVDVQLSWTINPDGSFEYSVNVRDNVSGPVHVQSLAEDVVCVESRVVHGTHRYQATYFARALASLLSEVSLLERVQAAKLLEAAGRFTRQYKEPSEVIRTASKSATAKASMPARYN